MFSFHINQVLDHSQPGLTGKPASESLNSVLFLSGENLDVLPENSLSVYFSGLSPEVFYSRWFTGLGWLLTTSLPRYLLPRYFTHS